MLLILVLLRLVVTQSTPKNGLETIQTNSGLIQGYDIPVPDSVAPDLDNKGKARSMGVFLGIPYAQPPIGDLRFARTVPVAPWTGRTWNATFYRPPCIQKLSFLRKYDFPNFTSNDLSEDCLYLNIFAPKFNNGSRDSENLPVMVWIHGGAYTYGSAIEYDGRVLATYGVVVVTINYRIGVMGYLSTDDHVAPGNYGMLDQIEALKWIQKNIHYFGGNPSKVIIFGQSSGGSTVSMHMFSPLTKGLFHGAIAQSGVATDTFAIYRHPYRPINTTQSLARVANCPTNDSQTMINCLRGKPPMFLAEAKVEQPPMSAPWVPNVDQYYLMDLPERLLERGEVNSVPIIAGSVTSETGADYTYLPGIQNGINQTQLRDVYSIHCQRYFDQADIMLEAIMCQYGGKPDDPIGNRQRLFEFMSYYEYIAGIYRLVDRYVHLNRNVWIYSYNYRSIQDPTPKYWGTYHAIELQYQFGMPFISKFNQPWKWNSIWPTAIKWTVADELHSRNMMELWSNFAKLLDPNTEKHQRPVWTQYQEYNKVHIDIDKRNSIHINQHPQDVLFWNIFVPKVLSGHAKPSECPAKTFKIIGK